MTSSIRASRAPFATPPAVSRIAAAVVPIASLAALVIGCSSPSGADAASDAANQDGTVGDAAPSCNWSGSWSVDATATLSDGCTATPGFPMLHIDGDGGLSAIVDGSSAACVTTSADPQSCHIGGFCDPWLVTLDLADCPSSRACSGVVTDLADGGGCSYSIVLNRVGP